jgi:hypothetical protein
MARAFLVLAIVVLMVRFVPGWYAAASRPPPSPNRPPDAIDYAEIDAATSLAIFDNRIEVRGVGLGDVGFERVYLEDIRDVVVYNGGIDIMTTGSMIELGIRSRLAAVALKTSIDRARERAATHR